MGICFSSCAERNYRLIVSELFTACKNDEYDKVKKLTIKYSILNEILDEYGFDILTCAIYYNSNELVKRLIDENAPALNRIELKINYGKLKDKIFDSPLEFAIETGNYEAVKFFIDDAKYKECHIQYLAKLANVIYKCSTEKLEASIKSYKEIQMEESREQMINNYISDKKNKLYCRVLNAKIRAERSFNITFPNIENSLEKFLRRIETAEADNLAKASNELSSNYSVKEISEHTSDADYITKSGYTLE